MEPGDYLKTFRRRWLVIVLAVLVGMVAAYFSTPEDADSDQRYSATHILFLDNASENVEALNRQLGGYSLLATVGEVPARAAAEVGFNGDPAVLALQVKATGNGNDATLRITASGRNAQDTATLADAFATQLMSYLVERDTAAVQSRVDLANEQIRVLEEELAQRTQDVESAVGAAAIGVAEARQDSVSRQLGFAYDRLSEITEQGLPSSKLSSLQRAVPVAESDGGLQTPSGRVARTAVGAIVGLFVGLILALIVDRLDPRIPSRVVAEAAFGMPVIAEIPKLKRRKRGTSIAVDGPSSPAAESFRQLRTAVLLVRPRLRRPHGGRLHRAVAHEAAKSAVPQVILVTAPADGAGASTTVAYLAASLAETGRTVLVLNCDFGHPRVHELLGVPDGPGITEIVPQAPGSPTLASLVRPTEVPGVSIVHSRLSREARSDLLSPLGGLVDEARQLADFVLLDTPAVLVESVAGELTAHADGVLMVCRVGRTYTTAAERAGELLGRLEASVFGVVLVGDKAPDDTRRSRPVDANAATNGHVTVEHREGVSTRPAGHSRSFTLRHRPT